MDKLTYKSRVSGVLYISTRIGNGIIYFMGLNFMNITNQLDFINNFEWQIIEGYVSNISTRYVGMQNEFLDIVFFYI